MKKLPLVSLLNLVSLSLNLYPLVLDVYSGKKIDPISASHDFILYPSDLLFVNLAHPCVDCTTIFYVICKFTNYIVNQVVNVDDKHQWT